MADETLTDEPTDRLTRMGAQLTEQLETLTEYRDGDQAIVFISDSKRSGISITGYEDSLAAVADLFIHMQAIFRANGKELTFIGIPGDASSLDDA